MSNIISASLFHRNVNTNKNDKNKKKKPNLKPTSDQKLELVFDVDDATHRASTSLRRFFRSTQSKFHEFISSGADTLSDLRTLVTHDRKGRIVFSCRRSSLEFLANFLLWGFLAVFVVRFVANYLGFRFGSWDVVWRRDRSLAGREVVVGRRLKRRRQIENAVSPLSDGRDRGMTATTLRRTVVDKRVSSRQKMLPAWWPNSLPSPILTAEKHEFQREANRLVRAIMDNRMSGKDLTEDDIIQLHRLCKTSGARVSFDTANARDSFYRASVDFVLNACSNVQCQPNLVQIDGEEARQFVCGLASNIGLDDSRAARIVCAAVAARTRSRFLQAWALEVQGKRSEALDELSKICCIYQMFPPEEYSPEMEMVAQGLQKHLRLEQREHLLKLLEQVCVIESQRIAIEALGLNLPRDINGESVTPGYS